MYLVRCAIKHMLDTRLADVCPESVSFGGGDSGKIVNQKGKILSETLGVMMTEFPEIFSKGPHR